MPTHPGFDGTPRPENLSSVRDLARLYANLLDELDVWGVTVIGNSLGGWLAAELALLDSPRVSGAILIDAVGAEVTGHQVAAIRGLRPDQLIALAIPHHYAFTSGWLGDRMITRSDPDPRHYAAAAAEQAPGTTVRLTVPGECTPVP